MNFLHMSFHTNSTKGKNFIFEQILCHNICTYWFNFEFLILNTSNFLLRNFFIYPSIHANSTKGLYFRYIVFYPMVFPQYGPSQIFLYYFGIEKTFGHNIAIIWFKFEFLIMKFLHIPMPWALHGNKWRGQ